jgi:hypothetical protein
MFLRPTAVLDADVLIPILSCDVLLTCFEVGLYIPVVTPKILAEVKRNLVTDFPYIDSTVLLRRAHFMSLALELHTHPDIEERRDILGINAKDRHIASIAQRFKVTFVVTNDRRLRREINALGCGVVAVTSDAFLMSLADQSFDVLDDVIRSLVLKRTRPAMSRSDFLDRLHPVFPRTVAILRKRGS